MNFANVTPGGKTGPRAVITLDTIGKLQDTFWAKLYRELVDVTATSSKAISRSAAMNVRQRRKHIRRPGSKFLSRRMSWHVKARRRKIVGIAGPRDSVHYAPFVEYGTAQYATNPEVPPVNRAGIYPRHARYLRIPTEDGGVVWRPSVSGQRPMRFLASAFQAELPRWGALINKAYKRAWYSSRNFARRIFRR